jgi:hypothetical protein
MIDIRKLPRKERSSYKPSSLWDATEHAIFLKYCPSKRDRCYHATANDMSARPLALRIPLYSVSEIFISLRILFVKVGIVSDAVICCKQITFNLKSTIDQNSIRLKIQVPVILGFRRYLSTLLCFYNIRSQKIAVSRICLHLTI